MADEVLVRLIVENADRIIDRLVNEAIRRELPCGAMSREEVVAHFESYLDAMVEALERPRAASTTAMPREKTERRIAGSQLPSVVEEYHLLQQCVLTAASAARAAIPPSELEAMNEFLNERVAAAVLEFSERSERQLEEALARAERGKKAREDALVVVSHDLRTPLNVIYANVHTLLADFHVRGVSAEKARVRRKLLTIQRAAERMDRFVKNMLDLARLQAGELRLRISKVDARQLLVEASEQVSTLAEQRSIDLIVELHEELWVGCDRDRVLQVLQNLLDNAIKFTPHEGSVALGVERSPQGWIFRVADSGPGIAEELLPLIFERFWQAPETAAFGTGLGLSIARGLVELHGGRIWAESRLGEGASFMFELPVPEHA